MRFTLHYEGPLVANGDAESKQMIREHFEPQLRELWTHEPLGYPGEPSRLLRPRGVDDEGDAAMREIIGVEPPRALLDAHGHVFAPLICGALGLGAELDVLMLRPSSAGQIVVGGGDIDNRLKTLFDALSAPQQAQQLRMGERATSDENPMYVLLDDDNRITKIAVETDRLLAAPHPSFVRLFIRVTTRILRPSIHNIDFGLN